MTCLRPHSLLDSDLGLWTLNPELCPLSYPCPYDRVKLRMGKSCQKSHSMGGGEGKETHIQFCSLNTPPPATGYCHSISSRTAHSNKYCTNPTLNSILILSIGLNVSRQGSLSEIGKHSFIHLTLIRILLCDKHCSRNCRRQNLIVIRHLTPGSRCLLGKGSEWFEGRDHCLLTNCSEVDKLNQLLLNKWLAELTKWK